MRFCGEFAIKRQQDKRHCRGITANTQKLSHCSPEATYKECIANSLRKKRCRPPEMRQHHHKDFGEDVGAVEKPIQYQLPELISKLWI